MRTFAAANSSYRFIMVDEEESPDSTEHHTS